MQVNNEVNIQQKEDWSFYSSVNYTTASTHCSFTE